MLVFSYRKLVTIYSVLELLTNKLFSQFPQPLGLDWAGSPRFNGFRARIGRTTVVEISAIVGYISLLDNVPVVVT